jgi:hypothetical protein
MQDLNSGELKVLCCLIFDNSKDYLQTAVEGPIPGVINTVCMR